VGALAGIGGCGLGAFFIAFSFFFRAVIGEAAAKAPRGQGPPVEMIQNMSWIHTAMGAVYLVGGVVLGTLALITARNLGRRRGRTFCIAASAVQCVAMPLGTVLAIFTILALSRPSVVRSFETPRA
jgi:hypothetical protein